jgi:hypothetical protein
MKRIGRVNLSKFFGPTFQGKCPLFKEKFSGSVNFLTKLMSHNMCLALVLLDYWRHSYEAVYLA